MSEHLLSDDGSARDGCWNSFGIWKTSVHDARAQRCVGQTWAEYMDELEDRQLLQRRKLRRLATRALLLMAFVAAACLYFQLR